MVRAEGDQLQALAEPEPLDPGLVGRPEVADEARRDRRLDRGQRFVRRAAEQGDLAAGDARAGIIKQIANAVGEGALAAIEAEKYLDTLDFEAQQASAAATGTPEPAAG